jgi:hypothetical protein
MYSSDTCASATLCITNPTRTWLGFNLCLYSERPGKNRPGHHTAQQQESILHATHVQYTSGTANGGDLCHLKLTFTPPNWYSNFSIQFRALFPNHRATVWYRALASIIPGREREIFYSGNILRTIIFVNVSKSSDPERLNDICVANVSDQAAYC